uniref:HIG1 domain-containing protein n=1 Tax=Plectus sambesii TaxID=2011161 RepID=A0A914X2Q1_9BILA
MTNDSRVSELPADCASCKLTAVIGCYLLGAMSLYNTRTPEWKGKPLARLGVQLFAAGCFYMGAARMFNWTPFTLEQIRRRREGNN